MPNRTRRRAARALAMAMFVAISVRLRTGGNYVHATGVANDGTETSSESSRMGAKTFGMLAKEMKDKVEDQCRLLETNATALEEILDIAWKSELTPWLEGMKHNFTMIVHKNDAKGPFQAGNGPPGSHIGQIVGQLAGTIRDLTAAATESALDSKINAFDIRVNYGWATFTMASMGAEVYSFEPMQSNIRFLRTALCLSPPEMRSRVTLFDFGLSDKNQECMILSVDNNIGDGQVVCHEDKEKASATGQYASQFGTEKKFRENVRLQRLDDVLLKDEDAEIILPKVDIVKMDTEGHEPFLVEGGKRFFRKFKPRVVHSEFDNRIMTSVHADSKGMMSFFVEELGYTVRENRATHFKRLGRGPLSKVVAMDMTNFNGLHDLIFEHE